MAFRSFGAQAFLIAWSEKKVLWINALVDGGYLPLAGVRLDLIKVMSEIEAVGSAWGNVWVAVSLPRDLFLEVERMHLKDGGTLDLTHAVSCVLLSRLPESLDLDSPPPVSISTDAPSQTQH